ncbi:MAG: hypothetical protein HY013_11515 [Candidatus Solibacter usitatus]|nr:hypothetical protein [Candidatus Solibacter usitatus]
MLKSVFLPYLLTCAAAFGQGLWYSRLAPGAAAPSPRADGVIVYDPQDRRLWMFGGLDNGPRNDLWVYSIQRQEWSEVTPSGTKPPARFGHTMILDPARRRLVVFGGQAGGFFSDTWAYNLERNSWSQLAPDNAGPSRRYAHSGVYDAPRDRMIVSHGFTGAGRFDDTWAFDLAGERWTDISPSSGRPLRRCLHHAVVDPANNQMLLYGGCASGFGPCPLGDLWSFDLLTHRWSERSGGNQPAPRQHYGMAFDSRRSRLVLFGGGGDRGDLNDTWEYDNGWSQIAPEGDTPSPRSRHQAAYAPDLGVLFFFGGRSLAGSGNELFALVPRPRLAAVRNAFSGQGGAVAPGEIVSLYGETLGSDGVSVTASGIPGKVLFASGAQINAQVPPSLAPLTEADFVVTYLGAASAPERVRVVASHPGIFPRVFNQDGSTNSGTNAASLGSIVVMFATGVAEPVELRIGGRLAELLYAGPAPEAPGVFQINARVPEGLGPDDSVPVVLIAAGVESPEVTLAVR